MYWPCMAEHELEKNLNLKSVYFLLQSFFADYISL